MSIFNPFGSILSLSDHLKSSFKNWQFQSIFLRDEKQIFSFRKSGKFVVRFVFRFDFNIAFKHWQFQSTEIWFNPFGPIQSNRSDSNPFFRVNFKAMASIQSIFVSNSIQSVRFNPFGPIRSDSSRFRIRFNPIFVVSDSIQSVRFTRSDSIRFNSV